MATDTETRLQNFLADPNVPDDVKRQAVAAYRGQAPQPGMASPGQVAEATRASGVQMKPSARQTAQIIGGAAGAVPGLLTLNPAGIATGVSMGAGGGGALYDIVTGAPGTPRQVATTLASTAAQMYPPVRAAALPARLLASGLASGATGGLWDLVTGESPKTLGGQAVRTGEDILAGGAGGVATEAGISRQREVAPSLRTPAERERLQSFAARENIPLSGADISGSRTAAGIEQYPMSQLTGARHVLDFRVRQMQQTEASLNRALDRIGARGTAGQAADIGQNIGRDIDHVKRAFSRAADQAYGAERDMLGNDRTFRPTNFARAAQDIIGEEERSPFGVPAPARRVAGTHTEEVAPGTVLYGPTGQPITLPAIRDVRDLDWADARRYLAQLGEKAYGGKGAQPGEVGNAQLETLHRALAQDMEAHLANHPDVAQYRRTIDRAYGEMKDRIRDRLNPLLRQSQTGSGADVVSSLFQPGKPDRTRFLREVLPRETFDAAANAWLDKQHVESTAPRGGVGGREQLSPAQFRAKMRPYIQSGQLEEMFPEGQTASWLREFNEFTPALGTAEQMAGNPSGTARGVEVARAVRSLIPGGVAAGGGAVLGPQLGASPMMGGVLGGVAGSYVAPEVVARLAYSGPGRALLGRLGTVDPDTVRQALVRQYLGQSLVRPGDDRALREQLGPITLPPNQP